MFIQTEPTPNPNTIKFFPGYTVTEKESVFFTTKEEAARSPLALELFDLEGVKAVFYSLDYISVTKTDEIEWEILNPEIFCVISDYFLLNKSVFSEDADEENDEKIDLSDPIVQKIYDLIETTVKPAVMQDGGNVIFKAFKDGIVYVKLQGACSGCPSASLTLKDGIENMLQYYVEEVKGVEAI
jgi:Fe-S cluster biogenesis protein NfuA